MKGKEKDIDRSAARKYFRGAGKWPWVLIVVGLPLTGILIGVIMIIAGFVWLLAAKLSAAAYEQQVDEIIAYEQDFLLRRGAEKLNLVEQQTGLIEPIRTIGRGYQPLLMSKEKKGFFGFLSSFTSKGAGKAPVLIARPDKKGRWRYSLIQTNVFMFGETQLYIYYAFVDITTGLIYEEGTLEYFYKDVCGITMYQKLESKYNMRIKKWQDVVCEFIKIYTPGCCHEALFDTSIGGASYLDRQFAAMRDLIREKKDER